MSLSSKYTLTPLLLLLLNGCNGGGGNDASEPQTPNNHPPIAIAGINQHVKLSEKEKEAVFKKYNITLTELPKILKDDPAIQGLGAKSGDVIKIVRKSLTAGESLIHKYVVEG